MEGGLLGVGASDDGVFELMFHPATDFLGIVYQPVQRVRASAANSRQLT